MSNALVESDFVRPAICPNPVFIIGSPRSGTSILAWSLAQHSRLWTSGELHLLFGLFGSPGLKERIRRESEFPFGWFKVERVSEEEFLGFVGLGLNALLTSRSEGKRWIEQTPVNTLMVDVLSEMFPGAVFLHILRDGRNVVNSMMSFQHALTASEREQVRKFNFYPSWAGNFREACTTWRQSVRIAAAFASKHPTRCFTIRYENLVAEPEKCFRDIFAFLSLPNEESSVAFLRSNRLHASFPQDQATSAAVPPKNPCSDWSAEWKKIFEDEALATLVECGMADDASWAQTDYDRLISSIRQIVAAQLPRNATALVVSKGDEQLISSNDWTFWHFPRTENGEYGGHHPADSSEAIDHLEALRAEGAEYLVIPATARWWLDHYGEFRQHLDACYRTVWDDHCCIIFHLVDSPAAELKGRTIAVQPALQTSSELDGTFPAGMDGKPSCSSRTSG